MKFNVSRRSFCVATACAATVLSPLIAAVSAFADVPPPDTNGDLPEETLYAIGVRLLHEGRTYEKAAKQFALAAQKAPTNPAHQIGLGCAHAARAASLGYAWGYSVSLARERADYPRQLRDWEAGRADFEQRKKEDPDEYGKTNYDDSKPELAPPRFFRTKDDNIPFTLTTAEATATIKEHVQKAQQAWEKGVALCQTPGEKADARYVQAWGLYLLQTYFFRYFDPSEEKGPTAQTLETLPFAPLQAGAIQAGKEAVRLAPDNALYAQALGDFLWNTDKEEAVVWYEKAAALDAKNANLLYFLYQEAVRKELSRFNEAGKAKPNPDPFESLKYLHQAQARDRSNAWPLYEEAGLLFRLAPYSLTGPSQEPGATPEQKTAALAAVQNKESRLRGKRAVDTLFQGNLLPRYRMPRYAESVPRLLAAAWAANGTRLVNQPYFSSFARLRELARSVMGYGQVMAQHEDNAAEAVRANRATIGMGFRLIGDWSTEDDIRKGNTVMEPLVGISISAVGYKGLLQAYEMAGDKAGANATQNESAAFQARVAEYRKAVAEQSRNGSLYDYY